MKKTFAALLLLCIALPASAEVSTEVLCFQTSGDKPVRFELRTYYDDAAKWRGGIVRYAKSKTAIPLLFKHEDHEELAEGRPYQFTTTWWEMVDGKINGEYEMTSQGAIVYSMTYRNARTGKQTDFAWAQDVDASAKAGCRW
ncbi:hypothetical protein K6W26_18685 [Burkholderia sp. AU42008]|uniref:hypothetical protein n=1 Tax=unclassified Burkholderia TaxID=2613784 RepID=UPI000B7A950A|nr:MULTISPECIES: hypothetical protein [unclassified Burkholderia]RQU13489.1 hypothetical protein DF152_17740 [Burkholderia cenocepacia]MBR8235086.1 hypothetical protein [Burkholderia sp. AU32357]MBY4875087.1 hypothetical protein [Burkholderia sp. AU42008]OXI39062.1 hypothetical protein CFB49_28180 [Burkholderia sp. AU17457]OXI65428.1 hypothetical protein CFB81_27885 [Burkholderia sp. AU28863]